MQAVVNKYFLLNPEKIREKRKNAPLIPKSYVTEPKARLL